MRRRKRGRIMDKRKAAAIGVILAAAIGVVVWAFQVPETTAPPDAPETQQQPMTYAGNVLSEEKDGKKVWELTADAIAIDPSNQNAALENVRGTFYQEDGQSVAVTAPKAQYDTAAKTIALSGGAAAVSSDGARLEAETMLWQSGPRQFSGAGKVRLRRASTVITGDKIESDPGFRRFKVSGNARVIEGGTDE